MQNCNVEIVAIVNDAVGTLMSAAHVDRNCEIGLILGTGCNACYMETLDNVQTWDEEQNHPEQVRQVAGSRVSMHQSGPLRRARLHLFILSNVCVCEE